MQAEIKPRIDLKNRTRLETVIPLSVPFINFQCKFCPTGERKLISNTPGRNHGLMDFELYKKIINDIGEFEKPIKVLRLYKDGEPLLNPKFAEMVKYAKEKKCAEKIDTTTNGSLLNPDLIRDIIDAGIDRINISIEGINNQQYLDFSKYNIDFDKFIKNLACLYSHKKQCEIFMKINGDLLNSDQIKEFYKIFTPISDHLAVEHTMKCWNEFELKDVQINDQVGIYGQAIKRIEVCPYIFYSMSVNSDGTVSACFVDWNRKLLIGDANRENIVSIWHGKALRDLQKLMLKKQRHLHQVCNSCGQMTHGMPDCIDEYSEQLLKKFQAEK